MFFVTVANLDDLAHYCAAALRLTNEEAFVRITFYAVLAEFLLETVKPSKTDFLFYCENGTGRVFD